jgi:hypothetical protein
MSDPDAPPVVSDRLTALILSSPRLRQLLLPDGLIRSPYKILDYQGTLILRDKTGAIASFERQQVVQFQQDGIGAILDHFWGAGVGLAEYTTTAGVLRDSFRDQGKRHLLIELARKMGRGERLAFTMQRIAHEMFTAPEEWLETTIDHPIARLSQTIVFPRDRRCQAAELVYRGESFPLHVMTTAEGGTQLNVRIGQPQDNTSYLIRWTW